MLTKTGLTVGDVARMMMKLPEDLIILNAYCFGDKLVLLCEDAEGEKLEYGIEAVVKDEDD